MRLNASATSPSSSRRFTGRGRTRRALAQRADGAGEARQRPQHLAREHQRGEPRQPQGEETQPDDHVAGGALALLLGPGRGEENLDGAHHLALSPPQRHQVGEGVAASAFLGHDLRASLRHHALDALRRHRPPHRAGLGLEGGGEGFVEDADAVDLLLAIDELGEQAPDVGKLPVAHRVLHRDLDGARRHRGIALLGGEELGLLIAHAHHRVETDQ
jgi:hypothetical protein